MTTAIVLDAGHASRHHGAQKGRLLVAGRMMLDWQYDALVGVADRFVYVCHTLQGPANWETVWAPQGGGPAVALGHTLNRLVLDEPIIVLFSDTWLPQCPADTGNWVGVAPAPTTREWDVPDSGKCWRRTVEAGTDVCVGLYRFEDPLSVMAACMFAVSPSLFGDSGEAHMADVLNVSPPWSTVRVSRWMDVGDPDSWRATDTALRSMGVKP